MLRPLKSAVRNYISPRIHFSLYIYKEGKKWEHIITKVECVQTYNERPSYTIIHKGTNKRPNTQKLFSVIIANQSLTGGNWVWFESNIDLKVLPVSSE